MAHPICLLPNRAQAALFTFHARGGGSAMDPRHFDDLVKRLAVGTTRRNALKVFGGAVTAGTLGRIRSSGADAADKVGICHLTGSATNPVVFITVSTNAIPAHKAHGDVINPNFQTAP